MYPSGLCPCGQCVTWKIPWSRWEQKFPAVANWLPKLRLDVWIGISGGSEGKESTCNVGDLGSIPGLGRCPGEGNGYPLQYPGLENSMDRGGWQATVHGVSKSWTQLSDFHFHFFILSGQNPFCQGCLGRGCGVCLCSSHQSQLAFHLEFFPHPG